MENWGGSPGTQGCVPKLFSQIWCRAIAGAALDLYTQLMMKNAANGYPSTNVNRGTTRVKITFGRSTVFEVFEKGDHSGSGTEILFVPEHIRHDVEMRLLSHELWGHGAL